MDDGRGEIQGLSRTWVGDDRLGLPRLVWALECECPWCKQEYLLLFEGRDRPDRCDVLVARMSPCEVCEEGLLEMEKRAEEEKARRRKRGGKKAAGMEHPEEEAEGGGRLGSRVQRGRSPRSTISDL